MNWTPCKSPHSLFSITCVSRTRSYLYLSSSLERISSWGYPTISDLVIMFHVLHLRQASHRSEEKPDFLMKNFIFLDITPYSPLKKNERFWGTRLLHLQGRGISQASFFCSLPALDEMTLNGFLRVLRFLLPILIVPTAPPWLIILPPDAIYSRCWQNR
jgi:hypothetical protein